MGGLGSHSNIWGRVIRVKKDPEGINEGSVSDVDREEEGRDWVEGFQ